MGFLLGILCFYFAYRELRMLAAVPFGDWGGMQYLLLVLGILLAGAGVFQLITSYRRGKVKAEKQAAEQAENEKKEREARRQAKLRDESNDDLAYLDELDAQEDAIREQLAKERAGTEEKQL